MAQTVEDFLAVLEHPLKQEVVALRQIILATDPQISEGIKWKVPSFRTTEYFATFHLRAADKVQIILHRGAKKREDRAAGLALADPAGLLTWLDKDRAAVTFRNLAEINAQQVAFAEIIRAWIEYV